MMTDDRLRRCRIHGPELRAYVEALVAAEAEEVEAQPNMPLHPRGTVKIHVRHVGEGRPREYDGATIVTEDDGEIE